MGEKTANVIVLVLCTAYVLAALAVATRARGPVATIMSNPAVYGWAQAVGGFLAVSGALWIFDGERRHREASERKARLEMREATLHLVWQTMTQMRGIEILMASPSPAALSPVTFDRVQLIDAMIADFPKQTIGADYVQWLVDSRLRLAQARRRCDEFNDTFRTGNLAQRQKALEQTKRLRFKMEAAYREAEADLLN